MELQEYWEAIQAKVCVKCIDGDGAGSCRLDPSRDCGVKGYLPLIVYAVNRVNSDRVDDYVAELRATVCAQCKHQTPDGKCNFRSNVDCGLDRYFPLIIDAIEGVNLRRAV